jgi:hypothetical protein
VGGAGVAGGVAETFGAGAGVVVGGAVVLFGRWLVGDDVVAPLLLGRLAPAAAGTATGVEELGLCCCGGCGAAADVARPMKGIETSGLAAAAFLTTGAALGAVLGAAAGDAVLAGGCSRGCFFEATTGLLPMVTTRAAGAC